MLLVTPFLRQKHVFSGLGVAKKIPESSENLQVLVRLYYFFICHPSKFSQMKKQSHLIIDVSQKLRRSEMIIDSKKWVK